MRLIMRVETGIEMLHDVIDRAGRKPLPKLD